MTGAETWGAAERNFTKLSLSAMPTLVLKIDKWISLRKSWTRPGHQNFKDKHGLQKDLQDLSLLGAQCLMEPHSVQVLGTGPCKMAQLRNEKGVPSSLLSWSVHASKATSDHEMTFQLTISPSRIPNHSWTTLVGGARQLVLQDALLKQLGGVLGHCEGKTNKRAARTLGRRSGCCENSTGARGSAPAARILLPVARPLLKSHPTARERLLGLKP